MVYGDSDSGDRSRRQRDGETRKHGSAGVGLTLWVIAAIILFIFFLVNQGKIISNLKETGFFGRVFGKTPSFVENAEAKGSGTDKNDVAPIFPDSSDSGINIVSSTA